MKPEEEVASIIQERLQSDVIASGTPKPRRAYITVKSGFHRNAISALLEAFPDTTISTITGLDLGDAIELDYHLWCGKAEATIRTKVAKSEPEIETITDIMSGASLYEREFLDLLGVKFLGHPDLRRLVLPEGWPKEQYPLRKDWSPEPTDKVVSSGKRWVNVGNVRAGTGRSVLNVVLGPQHPALHEPERFLFKLDGETVLDVEPRLGYAHRGIEKAAEQLMFFQNVHLVERVCGICNVAHTTCFCQAVESLGDIEVPPRATYLRTIVHELNRVHSHLLLLGIAGLEVGFESLFQYLWRDREIVLDLIEKLTENRIMAEFSAIGGVRRDLRPILANEIKKGLDILRGWISFYKKVFHDDPTFGLRTRGIRVQHSDIVRLDLTDKYEVHTSEDLFEIPVKKITSHIMNKCKTCPDFTSELADISVGGAATLRDWSTVIIRTRKGEDLFRSVLERGAMRTMEIEEQRDVLAHLLSMATHKKKIALDEVKRLKHKGLSIPPINHALTFLQKEESIMRDTRVEDIMTKDVVTVRSQVSVDELLDTMTRYHHMGYPVADDESGLVGIVTFEDFMKVSKDRRSKVTVGQIAKRKLVTAYPEGSVLEAFEKMRRPKIGRLLVVDPKDHSILRGVVTRTDIMHLLEGKHGLVAALST